MVLKPSGLINICECERVWIWCVGWELTHTEWAVRALCAPKHTRTDHIYVLSVRAGWLAHRACISVPVRVWLSASILHGKCVCAFNTTSHMQACDIYKWANNSDVQFVFVSDSVCVCSSHRTHRYYAQSVIEFLVRNEHGVRCWNVANRENIHCGWHLGDASRVTT